MILLRISSKLTLLLQLSLLQNCRELASFKVNYLQDQPVISIPDYFKVMYLTVVIQSYEGKMPRLSKDCCLCACLLT